MEWGPCEDLAGSQASGECKNRLQTLYHYVA